MGTKTCRDCKNDKPFAEMTRSRAFRDGIDTLCLVCNHRRVREWRAAGKRKSGEEAKRYRARYPEKVNARSALRAARERQATPAWARGRGNELLWLVNEAKALAVARTAATGFLWHIDHIVPIAGAKVSGLNVPWNIRVIPAQTNWRKGVKHAG